jgi:hypothetical protein
MVVQRMIIGVDVEVLLNFLAQHFEVLIVP